MTDTAPSAASVPAGWYPNPQNPAQQRWWDGTQWTDHVSAPAYAAAPAYGSPQAYEQLRAPEGTSWNTPWIWVVMLLPLLSFGTVFLYDFNGMFESMLLDPSNPTAMYGAMFTPGYLLAQVLPWLIYGAAVLFSFLDWRELNRRGVPKPFHWAFGFLGVVYPIGRAVVTNRRGMGGMVVLWISIAVIVLGIIVSVVWSVVLFNQLVTSMLSYPGLR